MTDPNDITAEDARLLEMLQEALATARPIPEGRIDLAGMTFAWRTIDEELALLAFDSSEELMAVRADTTVRALSFELDDLLIDLQIDFNTRAVIGQIEPEGEGQASLIHRDGVLDTTIGDLGTFKFEDVPTGPIAVRVTLADRTVRTEWFLI
jgi:hypothetical protein